jgi:hypothetical protein
VEQDLNRFRWLCATAILGSLLVWVLPARFKPYRLRRDFEDYKILFVEHDYEFGFADNGMLDLHISQAYGGTRQALVPIRQDWIDHGSRSRKHWPASSLRLHYDEWGPSHFVREDGVEVTQTGKVLCVPYSVFALGFAVLLGCTFIRWLPRTSKIPKSESPNE